jgi:archaeal cell division control protein 6
MVGVENFFENFLQREAFFLDKSVLLSAYIPDEIPFRDEQIQEVANILAPVLRCEKPSNLFIYGKTGTGKTVSVKHVLASLKNVAVKQYVPLRNIYLNCKLKKVADTEYRLIAQLIREFGKEVPATGLPTDELYSTFYHLLDAQKSVVLLVLDEIDQLTKKIGDDILYNLTRINGELKRSHITLIGISNSLIFSENLDPRVKSSLSEEELIFAPYNAFQIQDILQHRVAKAFAPDILEAGVVQKCAAFAARDHGDARRAIDLLRVAGEIAERSASSRLTLQHLDDAERKVESDKILQAALGHPKQFQLVLYTILLFSDKQRVFTGEIYEVYQKLCQQVKFPVLTQRRISDILAELDMLGMIQAKIISKGRYGRTREIALSLGEAIKLKLKELLEKSLQLDGK